jgi:hypothetical protein
VPITPFHFGPGLLIKSAIPRRFSFYIFIVSQIFIDIETAWNILRGNERLHVALHTYIGSLVVVLFCLILRRPLFWNRAQLLALFKIRFHEIDRVTVILSSLIGVWSHVLLDSIMHADMTPLAPLSKANEVLGIISLVHLHLGCYLAGILGFLILLGRRTHSRYASPVLKK